MSENVIQASFASGELSPSLFARVDIAKYHSGAARMRNMFVDYRSGASTRPGTEFVRPTKQGQGPVRLIRFQQSTSVTYALEFGNNYLRFVTQDGSVVEVAAPVTSVAQGSGGTTTIVTAPGHGYANGDLVFTSGVGGMQQINDRYFIVQGVTGSTFEITDPFTGNHVDSTGWLPLTSPGQVQRVYTISTPYAASELALLKFSQKASKMNLTHPNHPPYVLTLISATNWTLTPASIGATIGPPAGLSLSASATGPANVTYVVTAIDDNNQESTYNFVVGTGVLDLRTTSGTININWTSVAGASSYNVYRTSFSYVSVPTGQYGFIGTTTATSFADSNIGPDFTSSPPLHENPFTGVDANPQVSAYFQQRLVLANGGGNDVDRFWMGKAAADYNFDDSNPSQADDAIDARLVSLEVNEIKSMIPMPSGLIMLTTKGAWQVSGGAGGVATQGGPVTPSTLTATPQAYIGANDVPPILINYDILFVQQKGSIIRDLSYNIYANIYTGNDISILSSHLFYGHQILEWAYAEEPFKIVWCVREDGTLLSLTILKEQDMYGWARHDTLGNFQSVCSVTEGMVDATYFVVQRPLPDGTSFVQQIERLADRTFQFGAEDAWSVDAAVRTSANEPASAVTIVLSGSNAVGQSVTLQASAAVFTSGMVGWVARVGGGIVIITQFINTQTLIGTIQLALTGLLPDDPLNRPNIAQAGTWSIDQPITKVFGLDHLEGQQVSVLADGGVVNGLTVNQGSITLPAPASKVIAGLGFQAQLQTMPLDIGNEQNTIQGKRKKVGALTARVKDSRGLKTGRTFSTVVPIKELNRVTTLGQSTPLITGDERIIMDPLWDVPGQICFQVDDPLPVTILGVIPEIAVGDTPK